MPKTVLVAVLFTVPVRTRLCSRARSRNIGRLLLFERSGPEHEPPELGWLTAIRVAGDYRRIFNAGRDSSEFRFQIGIVLGFRRL